MAIIPIPGVNATSIASCKTEEPELSGLKKFPCAAGGWTRQTGVITKASLHIAERTGRTSIVLQVVNGQYGDNIWISCDPQDIPPTVQDREKVVQQNLDTLVKTIAILGCHSNGNLDTSKLEKSRGQIISFICKFKGYQDGKNGGRFPQVQYILKGQVPDLEAPVEMPFPPDGPGGSAASGLQGDPLGDDIPF